MTRPKAEKYPKASGHRDSPAVSLVLCTRNRAERLKICLEYIARQNPSCDWELVIVDNGSTDDTGKVLAEYAVKVPFPTHILYEGRPGKSRGLNQALRVTRGDIVAFIDDDCYVAPDYIDRAREVFEDPKIGFAGGRVDLFDPTDYPMSIWISTEPVLVAPRSYLEPGLVPGGNMMLRRQVLEAIGGFDPALGPGSRFTSGEDPDIQARASFAGWWGLYTPDVVVAHHHRRKAKDAPAWRRGYSMGTGACKAKFLLIAETRPIYLRAWYWTFRRVLSGRYALRDLLWELQGAAAYLAHRLWKRVSRTAHDRAALARVDCSV
jgi:glycosyltransferase involved in cell wall biosynthesis